LGCSTLNATEKYLFGDASAPATALAAGSTATPAQRPGKDFYHGKYSFVRIEASEPGGRSGLPLRIEAERLSAALAELHGSGTEFKGKPLFSADELTELVPVLVDALQQAQTAQDVVFAIAGKHSQATLFETESVTTGRLFADSGRLQLILGMTRVNFGDELRGNHTLKPFIPGSRAKALESAAPVAGASWVVASGRPDWLSIDAPALSQSATPASAAATAAPPPVAATPPAVAPMPAPALAPTLSADPDVVERRLSTLQRLRQKGLISEEELQTKRKAVLDGL
jgi:hypothetical protein